MLPQRSPASYTQMRREHPSPRVSCTPNKVARSPNMSRSNASHIDDPLIHTPSPLRKGLFLTPHDTDIEEQYEDDELDEDDSPSCPVYKRLESPFASNSPSRLFSRFKSSATRSAPGKQTIFGAEEEEDEEDEGAFIYSNTSPTLSFTPSRVSRNTGTRTTLAINHLLTPAPSSTPFPVLAPLPAPRFFPQTPAETEHSLKRQSESMTRLSLGDESTDADDDEGFKIHKRRLSNSRHTRRKIRTTGPPQSKGLFQSILPSTPSPPNRIKALGTTSPLSSSASAFFGPSISFSHSPPTSESGRPRHIRQGSHSSITSSTSATSTSTGSSSKELPRKFRPRDSGIGGLSDSEEGSGNGPRVVVSVDRSALDNNFGAADDDTEPRWSAVLAPSEGEDDEDSFIMKTLANGGAAGALSVKKKMPNTPVKRAAFLAPGINAFTRPWMSSSKVIPGPRREGNGPGRPRQSLPLLLTSLPNRSSSPSSGGADSRMQSPLATKSGHLYPGLGGGRPSTEARKGKREGSGSSMSDMSIEGTPTRKKGLERTSASDRHVENYQLTELLAWELSKSHGDKANEDSIKGSNEESRLEREFEVLETIGIGEFGSAVKVRYKNEGSDSRLYAIKKTAQIEGVKHR
ncbi:hypothetical protein SISSUDRAFT_41574 [Sistotremastrum suecicum HHB10207 ss-3]|uniref:Protein kinase domain-containing protein n=1 Tax=Sistotremastrum suecicum HHB10207 ss-3 TaxID=1314776 RepID=A0A166H7D5_9AGAM|nr:hypothetical protein SISSUDRAFT_41574 [Sistotremastrum suecicum HHB10207 ss-3]